MPQQSRQQQQQQQQGHPMMDPLLAPSSRNHHHGQDSSERSSGSSVARRRHNHQHQGRILDRDADFFQSRGRWSGVELMPRDTGRRNRSSLSVGGRLYHFQNRRHDPATRYCACCSWIHIKRRLRQWLPVLWDDWFHTLAYQRTWALMMILFMTYFAIVIGFGFVYLAVSVYGSQRTPQPDGSYVTTTFCDMDISDHMDAFYFSLSTMTTIGYGASDYYFGGCWTPLLLVLCQVCTAITFDAVAVGLLFTRLSRGRKRSKTIVVSNQAVVQVVQGIPYFMFRVGELRRFPLMDASVRVFCIRHERIPRVYPSPTTAATTTATTTMASSSPTTKNNNDTSVASSVGTARTATTSIESRHHRREQEEEEGTIPVETTHFVTRAMKLLHPDESLMHSNHILMSLPQVIVHRMDAQSPLVPPAEWYDGQGHHHTFPINQDNPLDVQHQIQKFWRDRGIEIVVLVEGIDELTGTAVQTRHSYCTTTTTTSHRSRYDNNVREDEEEEEEGDVAWNRAFVNCILPHQPSSSALAPGEEEGDYNDQHDDDDDDLEGQTSHYPYPNSVCTVDFGLFHDTVPTPRDCLASPYVPY